MMGERPRALDLLDVEMAFLTPSKLNRCRWSLCSLRVFEEVDFFSPKKLY